jgi:hypothetical protein
VKFLKFWEVVNYVSAQNDMSMILVLSNTIISSPVLEYKLSSITIVRVSFGELGNCCPNLKTLGKESHEFASKNPYPIIHIPAYPAVYYFCLPLKLLLLLPLAGENSSYDTVKTIFRI